MSIDVIGAYAVAALLGIGALFTLVGAIGLLKFRDSMTRLHAPTKVGTMGVGALLVASVVHAFVYGDGSLHELLVMAFLFVTAPISANFLAKVSLHRGTCEAPPVPDKDKTWSTFHVPKHDKEA